jgi:hypothetical protein
MSRQSFVTSARAESRTPSGGDGRAAGKVSFSRKTVAPAHSRAARMTPTPRSRGGIGCDRIDATQRPPRSGRRATERGHRRTDHDACQIPRVSRSLGGPIGQISWAAGDLVTHNPPSQTTVTRQTLTDGGCDHPLSTFGAASVRYPHCTKPSLPAMEVANASRLGEGPTHR